MFILSFLISLIFIFEFYYLLIEFILVMMSDIFFSAVGVVGRVARPVGKTYGPGDTHELTTMPFAGSCSTTELPVHIGQVGSIATR